MILGRKPVVLMKMLLGVVVLLGVTIVVFMLKIELTYKSMTKIMKMS